MCVACLFGGFCLFGWLFLVGLFGLLPRGYYNLNRVFFL